MQHINKTLETLTSRLSVEFCRFITDAKAFSSDKHEMQGELLLQDELASMLGRLVTGLVALRVKRCLWMVAGWPVRICGILGSENAKRETLAAFAKDHEAAVALGAVEDPGNAIKAYQARSVFTRVAVQNLVEAPGDVSDTLMQGVVDVAVVLGNSKSRPSRSTHHGRTLAWFGVEAQECPTGIMVLPYRRGSVCMRPP